MNEVTHKYNHINIFYNIHKSKDFKVINAVAFIQHFIISYNESQSKSFEWSKTWRSKRSSHMLWESNSVIQCTAARLGLAVAKGEPLRLDAAFIDIIADPPGRRLPIHAALEHENNYRSFDQEIRVLMSVCAPLKVGITYTPWGKKFGNEEIIKSIHDIVKKEFFIHRKLISEDLTTEYLFLVGEETQNELQSLTWNALTFKAGDGPDTSTFSKI